MLIAVVGGKLQGIEAIYLARKAGIRTVLIDKNPNAIAADLCDDFVQFRFDSANPKPPLKTKVDLILPAIEDIEALQALSNWSQMDNIPLALDLDAFLYSQSKSRSDMLFHDLGLPAPKPWPHCTLPIVVKPNQESGSRGVEIIHSRVGLERYTQEIQANNYIIQEYLEGPSYSIEVIGTPGHYFTYQVTELHMDRIYDCSGVTAPSNLSQEKTETFKLGATAIAEAIQLKGIMDVEVILHDNELKFLEIDARLPSQTPMTVYHSTGLNMVEQLYNLFTGKEMTANENPKRFACIEHILVQEGAIEVCGEHIMAQNGTLHHCHSFFGAEEAITSYRPQKSNWVATMIFVGKSQTEIDSKRRKSYQCITSQYLQNHVHDEVTERDNEEQSKLEEAVH